MDTEKKKPRLIEELDDETKRALMSLFLERRALREFTKIVAAGLEEDRIPIPARPPWDHPHDR